MLFDREKPMGDSAVRVILFVVLGGSVMFKVLGHESSLNYVHIRTVHARSEKA